jgi:hypothetical protein
MASVLPKNVRGQPLAIFGGREDRHRALPGPERLLVLLFHVHLVAAWPTRTLLIQRDRCKQPNPATCYPLREFVSPDAGLCWVQCSTLLYFTHSNVRVCRMRGVPDGSLVHRGPLRRLSVVAGARRAILTATDRRDGKCIHLDGHSKIPLNETPSPVRLRPHRRKNEER